MSEYTIVNAEIDFNNAFEKIYKTIIEKYDSSDDRLMETLNHITYVRNEFRKFINDPFNETWKLKLNEEDWLDDFQTDVQSIVNKLTETVEDPIQTKLAELANSRRDISTEWKKHIIEAINVDITHMTFPLTFTFDHYYGISHTDYELFIEQFGLYIRGNKLYLAEDKVPVEGDYATTKKRLNELRQQSAIWFIDLLIERLGTRQYAAVNNLESFPVGSYTRMVQRLRNIGIKYHQENNCSIFYWKN